jgi:hypothetical protein
MEGPMTWSDDDDRKLLEEFVEWLKPQFAIAIDLDAADITRFLAARRSEKERR